MVPRATDTRRLISLTLALTLAIEGLAILFRFGLGFESSRDTAPFIAPLTMGLRIHHGYLGLLMLLVASILRENYSSWIFYLRAFGLAFFLSDLVHHFLVLWPITGSPQFDLYYFAPEKSPLKCLRSIAARHLKMSKRSLRGN